MSIAAKTVDEYIASSPDSMRPGLEQLRKSIRAAAPRAEEGISYGVPTYKHLGMLVSFGAAKKHLALYGASSSFAEQHAIDLSGYDTAKGTVRFPPDRPIPVDLVKKLVRARVAENQENARLRERRRNEKKADARKK